jgi:CDP-glycerol glycerophosphotransferase (TagB/SpsB family)
MYNYFCVASEGYKDFFIKRKGINADKLVVTGIPNFDNTNQYLNNDFPHKNYVLVCTSDARETFKIENRVKFIKECVKIAAGRQLIFKLHPNENYVRASKEINKHAPGAVVYSSGNTNHMIANCGVLITKYSSVSFVGLALGKEVHSYFDLEDLKALLPIQNGGTSAEQIAKVGFRLLDLEFSAKKLL